MSASETLVVETAARVLADLADPQTIVQKCNDAWKAPLWSSQQEIGLELAWVSENGGGVAAFMSDGFGIIRESGRAALAAPLAETLPAGWLPDQVDLAAPGGAMTVAPVRPKDRLNCDAGGRINRRLAPLLDLDDEAEDTFHNKLDFELKVAPKLQILGGTTEVLRGIIARGLRLR